MKRVLLFGIVILMMLLNIPWATLAESDSNDVDMEFKSGFGLRIKITNNNEFPIYNVSLENLNIHEAFGFIILALPDVVFLPEIPAHSEGYLSMITISFPEKVTVSANVSYYAQSDKIMQEAQGVIYMISFLTWVIEGDNGQDISY